MTTRPESLVDPSTSSLSLGDSEAAAAEWVAAVSYWEAALSTPDRGRAESRLRWFLESAARATNSGHHRRHLNPVMLGAGAAVVGTSLVLIAQEFGNPWQNAFALVAWFCFFVAATSGVLFAYHHRPQPRPPLTSSSVDRARELAKQLDSASATMPNGPWPLA